MEQIIATMQQQIEDHNNRIEALEGENVSSSVSQQQLIEEIKKLRTSNEENKRKMQELEMHKTIAEHYAQAFNLETVKSMIEERTNNMVNEIMQMVKQANESKEPSAKPILESKAINDLQQLDDAKNYRNWNKKFKNALEQTRPYARNALAYI